MVFSLHKSFHLLFITLKLKNVGPFFSSLNPSPSLPWDTVPKYTIMDKRLGTLLHFWGDFQFTQVQPLPLTPQTMLDRCIQNFSEFRLCVGRVGGGRTARKFFEILYKLVRCGCTCTLQRKLTFSCISSNFSLENDSSPSNFLSRLLASSSWKSAVSRLIN